MRGPIAQLLRPAEWDWGSVPDWLLLVTAVVGTILALRQLARAGEANRDNWRIQQGIQLMQIDDKYEVTLQASRTAITRLQRRCQAQLAKGDEAHLPELISAELSALVRDSHKLGSTSTEEQAAGKAAIERYFVLMQLPTYLETVGLLVEDGLVSEEAILKLYDAMIDRVIGNILPHITMRRDNNPEFLRYAELLHAKAHARMEAARART